MLNELQEKIAAYEKLRDGSSVVRFGQLSLEAKAALAWYMSVDGSAWSLPPALRRRATSEEFIETVRDGWFDHHMNLRIGFHPGISVKDLKKAVVHDTDFEEDKHETFDRYHEWYLNIARPVDHDVTKPLWPVILAEINADYLETLQDGWHRFHCYIRKGIQKIPALHFLPID